MNTLGDLQKQVADLKAKYAVWNSKVGHDAWDGKADAMGLASDVGYLMEYVMAKENLRTVEDADAKMAHELSSCLWSILALADIYEIDLETEFQKIIALFERRIEA